VPPDIENSLEEWRPVPEWDGLYEVSNLGRVRSLDRCVPYGRYGNTKYRGRVLRPGWSTGYAHVNLVETGQGVRECYYVHDLVLAAFVGPKPEGVEVCYGPAGASDNSLTNLRYDTRSANALDRHRWGRGWTPRPKKPPTHVRCAVCQCDLWVTRRRTATRLCGSPECLSVWGRISQERKEK